MLTNKDIEVLSEPFDKKTIGVKIQSITKDRKWASLVCYLQHTDVYGRLEKVDPAWTCEITGEFKLVDIHYVRMKMTVKGVVRENTGDGNDLKGASSDALKRAAMLFGVGRYLYDSEIVWVEYNEDRDKFRSWTIEDYEQALAKKKAKEAAQNPPKKPETENKPAAAGAPPASIKERVTALGAAKTGPTAVVKSATQPNNGKMSDAKVHVLTSAATSNGWLLGDIEAYIYQRFGVQSMSELDWREFNGLLEHFQKNGPGQQQMFNENDIPF